MLYREWKVHDSEEENTVALMTEMDAEKLLCKVLTARGMNNAQEVADMLCEEEYLPDPMTMIDMEKAVDRITHAIENEELIAVFGDYDVDGITSTSLVYTYLESCGAQVFYKLPSRNDDDYGLSVPLVDSMADKGISLIITVDNGITAFEAIERANERGVSVVVTDHHLPYDTLPAADALVDPCRQDDESGLDNLSGAGVAFMLLAALEGCQPQELLPIYGDLAAIGTVADVMKLTGPNRVIVRAGLASLQDTKRAGLAALVEACGWKDKTITVENISYGIAPRLNAAGRMDDATTALQLLLAEDEEEAAKLVENLQQQNISRQAAEQEILEIIEKQLEQDPDLSASRVLVIWGDGWHQGVIGIVASRLVDKYAKPAIAISFDEGEGRGSGRSFGGFSLHGAISSCEDILLRFGGHDLAAGFSLKKEYVKQFRKRVNKWAAENSPVPKLPAVCADAVVQLSELSVKEVQSLQRLAPCGSGNPQPIFLIKNVTLDAVYSISEGKHTRLRFRQENDTLYAVLFGVSPDNLAYRIGDLIDVLVVISIYENKNGMQVSARVVEMRPSGMTEEHVSQNALFESVLAGHILQEDIVSLLLPSRDDTAQLYRKMRTGIPLNYMDLRPAMAAFGEEKTGKMLTSLATLEELNLIEKDEKTACYKLVQVAEKKDLANGTLMKKLQKCSEEK